MTEVSQSSLSTGGKCIFVMGMQRSGTSALTGLLCRFGAIPGNDLLPANASNPKGFFESRAVVNLNDDILQVLGSSWDDMKALPADWHSLPVVQPFREAISTLLTPEVGGNTMRVIKDPRLSKTLPLWLDVLAELNIQPVFIICIREPAAVAHSVKMMVGFPFLKSLILYSEYGLHAELYSRGFPRVIVSYSDLLDDWQGVLKKISIELGLGLSLEAADLQEHDDGFISSELNRSQPDVSELQRCGKLGEIADAIYQALQEPVFSRLNVLRQSFIAYRSDVMPWTQLLLHVQLIEGRFPNVDLGPRYSSSRMQTRMAWSDSLSAEFDPANEVACKWVCDIGRKTIRLELDRPGMMKKIRLIFVNRPAHVRVHSLVLQQDEVVLSRWGHLHESLIGQSKSAFDLTLQGKEANDAWIFLDSKGYVDIKLPDGQLPDSDRRCSLVMDIEVTDISAAVKPLLLKVSLLQKKLAKLRENFRTQNIDSNKKEYAFSLGDCFRHLYELLRNLLGVTNKKIK